jgi:isoquinoline 1-oxidoreductase beta subunit
MCKLTAGLDAQGNVQALHMRISGQSILAGIFPQNVRDGRDPVVFQGLNDGGGEAMIGYTVPAPADRPRDAQPACAAGLLARREPEPERDLPRVFHRRDRARHGQDPLALRRAS